MENSSEPKPRVVNQLNRLALSVFAHKARRDAAELRLKDATARHKATLARLDTQLEAAKARLLEAVQQSGLLTTGSKSFSTLLAAFLSKDLPVKFKVNDPIGVLRRAKKLGITRLIADRKVTYVVNPDKLQEYLNEHPEHAEEFEPFLRLPGVKHWFGVRPNDTYLTTLDTNRLTNKIIPLTDD